MRSLRNFVVPTVLATSLTLLASCGSSTPQPIQQTEQSSQPAVSESVITEAVPEAPYEEAPQLYTPGQTETVGLSGSVAAAIEEEVEATNEVDCSLDKNSTTCFPPQVNPEVDYSKLTPGEELEFPAEEPMYHSGTDFKKTYGVFDGGKEIVVIREPQIVEVERPTVDLADDGITYSFENPEAKRLYFEMKRIYSDMISRESGFGDGSAYKSRLSTEQLATILIRTDNIIRDKVISEDEARFGYERVERAYNNQINSLSPLQGVDRYFEETQSPVYEQSNAVESPQIVVPLEESVQSTNPVGGFYDSDNKIDF